MIKPWGSDVHPPPNPISMMNQIGGSVFMEDNEHARNYNSLSVAIVPTLQAVGEGEPVFSAKKLRF